MTTQTISATKRNGEVVTVESPFTSDHDAISKLRQLVASREVRSQFAQNLLNAEDNYGLSPKQSAWVHILVVGAINPPTPPGPEFQLDSIRGMMDQAIDEGLKSPRMKFTLASGKRLVLSVGSARSQAPGKIWLTDGGRYRDGRAYFGTVDLEGGYRCSNNRDEEILNFIVAFDADPAAAATAYGHRTGTCCFCARHLSTAESVAVGYGPICADKFGLPWGEARAASSMVVRADMN